MNSMVKIISNDNNVFNAEKDYNKSIKKKFKNYNKSIKKKFIVALALILILFLVKFSISIYTDTKLTNHNNFRNEVKSNMDDYNNLYLHAADLRFDITKLLLFDEKFDHNLSNCKYIDFLKQLKNNKEYQAYSVDALGKDADIVLTDLINATDELHKVLIKVEKEFSAEKTNDAIKIKDTLPPEMMRIVKPMMSPKENALMKEVMQEYYNEKIFNQRLSKYLDSIFTEVFPSAEIVQMKTKNILEKLAEFDTQIVAEIKNLHHFAHTLAISISIAIIIVSILMFFITINSINSIYKSIRNLKNKSKVLATGDLTEGFKIMNGDELDEVAKFFDNVTSTFNKAIHGSAVAAIQLVGSTNEISETIISFSNSAQDQASAIDEVTSTLEELSANMNHISNTTQEMQAMVNEGFENSKTISEKANSIDKYLAAMKISMKNIASSSSNVKNIISFITNISDRINLLSLNASIEAARAGDSGRGFGVVADEISRLAEQTAQNVEAISNLIIKNEKEINEGESTIENTVEHINEIINALNKDAEATHAIHYIAEKVNTATQEQKIGINEVALAISAINHLVQTNAVGAQQVTASIEEIAAVAETIQSDISFFKLTHENNHNKYNH